MPQLNRFPLGKGAPKENNKRWDGSTRIQQPDRCPSSSPVISALPGKPGKYSHVPSKVDCHRRTPKQAVQSCLNEVRSSSEVDENLPRPYLVAASSEVNKTTELTPIKATVRPILVYGKFGTSVISTTITNYSNMVNLLTGEPSEPGDLSHWHLTDFVLRKLKRRGILNPLGHLVISTKITDEELNCIMQEYTQMWRKSINYEDFQVTA